MASLCTMHCQYNDLFVNLGLLCALAINLNPDYLRALLRRAELYEKTDKLEEALEDYKKILERDPGHTNARQACMVSLPVGICECGSELSRKQNIRWSLLSICFYLPLCFSEVTAADSREE